MFYAAEEYADGLSLLVHSFSTGIGIEDENFNFMNEVGIRQRTYDDLLIWACKIKMYHEAEILVDAFLPHTKPTMWRETLRAAPPVPASRRLRLSQLAGAFGYSSALVVPLLILAPPILALYGKPYDSQLTVYALLLSVQWANGVGRAAVRHAVVVWDARRIGVAVGSGAVAAVLTCALGVGTYGALAAAAASLIGALMVNGRDRHGSFGPARRRTAIRIAVAPWKHLTSSSAPIVTTHRSHFPIAPVGRGIAAPSGGGRVLIIKKVTVSLLHSANHRGIECY